MAVGKYETLVSTLSAAFPQAPPPSVVDEEWGDYHDAKLAFEEHGAKWNPKSVFENRSIIRFVNSPAFMFLLPHFFRASEVEGETRYDVLDSVISALRSRLRMTRELFTPRQARALLNWRVKLSEDREEGLLHDIDKIEYHLRPPSRTEIQR